MTTALIVAGLLGVSTGMIIRTGRELFFGLILLFGTLYFVNGAPFPASLTFTFIPLIRDTASRVYQLLEPGGLVSIGAYLGAAFITYEKVGIQSPAYKKE